jgi:hypothetical protein
VDPMARQRIQEHFSVHMKYLQQLNPQAYKGLVQQIRQMERQPMQKPQPRVSAPMQRRQIAPPAQPEESPMAMI